MFIFTAEPQHHDRITDFNPEEDALRFDRSYGGTLGLARDGVNTVIHYGDSGQNTVTIEWYHLSLADIDLQWIGA